MLLDASQISTFLAVSYDILVLGGGTAGLTVASRLSANPAISVGVLETGTSQLQNPLVTTPGLYGVAVGNASFDWRYVSTPQPTLNGRGIRMAAGKMLGGSSALNYLVWCPPHGKEIDTWGKLGSAGWNWNDFSSYARKAETIHAPSQPQQLSPNPPFNPAFHGNVGPIDSGFSLWTPAPTKTFIPTMQNLRATWNKDPFSGDNAGVWYSLNNVDPATVTRDWAHTGYLLPVLNRPNLRVLTGVTIHKVELDRKKRVTGAKFYGENGTEHFVKLKSKGEAIVSAGSIQSPKILELSGIGRKDVLRKAGIELKVENKNVGENLQDHVFAPIVYELKPGLVTMDLYRTNATFAAAALQEYQTNRTGILTGTTGVLSMLPLESILPRAELNSLIQKYGGRTSGGSSPTTDPFLTHALPTGNDGVPQIELIFSGSRLANGFTGEPGKTYISILPALMHPLSRGSIHINSSDAHTYPVINPQFVSHNLDKDVFIAALKFANKIGRTEPFASQIAGRRWPSGNGEISDGDWWKHIQGEMETVKHPIGTCSMLPKKDGGVVDERLRVYDVEGLRVVDASIFPSHVSAHTQLSTYAVAEKASKMILEDWEKR